MILQIVFSFFLSAAQIEEQGWPTDCSPHIHLHGDNRNEHLFSKFRGNVWSYSSPIDIVDFSDQNYWLKLLATKFLRMLGRHRPLTLAENTLNCQIIIHCLLSLISLFFLFPTLFSTWWSCYILTIISEETPVLSAADEIFLSSD